MRVKIIGFNKGYHAHLAVVLLLKKFCKINAGVAWKLSDKNIREGISYTVQIKNRKNEFLEELDKKGVVYIIEEK